MENEITAHRGGKVTELNVGEGAAINSRRSGLRSKIMSDRPQPPGKVPVRATELAQAGATWAPSPTSLPVRRPGPGRSRGQTFWAIWDRERRELHERTRMMPPWIARGEVWTEPAEGEHRPDRLGARGRRHAGPDRGGAEGAEERAGPGLPARRRGRVGAGGLPDRRGRRVRLDPQAPGRGRVRRADRRAADPLRGARGRGRVLRLPPPPHRLGLVGRGRHHRRRRPSPGTWSAGSTTRRGLGARAIWVDGRARGAGAGDLRWASRRSTSTARGLEFSAEAERRMDERRTGGGALLLPPAVRDLLAARSRRARAREGLGVMEHHDAHW